MLRTKLALFALIPAFTFGAFACVGDPTTVDEEFVVEDEAAIVAPQRDLFGTFRSTVTRPGTMPLLALMSDGTYHRGMMVACFTAPCNPVQEDGYYSLWIRDRGTYMTLYSHDGAVDKYAYGLAGNTLRIRRLGESTWTSMTRTVDASWCGEPADCELQNLPVGPCAGAWYCGLNVCSYSCWPPDPIE